MSSTCIVIPFYNETVRFDELAFKSFLDKGLNIHFLLVNDGSTDQTGDLISRLAKQNKDFVTDLQLTKNQGKAEAVRLGVLKAIQLEFENIGFWDADFSAPLLEINNLLSALKAPTNFILGSRVKRMGAFIKRDAKRHYLGRVFSTISSKIVKLPVYDSQCGAKLFSNGIAAIIFRDPFITKWLFDVELLMRYRNHYGKQLALSQILEVPLNNWFEVGGSKLKFSDFLKVPIELYQINKTYN